MPKAAPPSRPVEKPHRYTLPAFTHLERIHSDRFASTEFNPIVPALNAGGRFDTIDGDHAYLYAGEDIPTAVEETLLRDVPHRPAQPRYLPRAQLMGRKVSVITAAEDIPLVDLRSRRNLAAVGQDEWLVHCESVDYRWTRKWAHAIRCWDEDAAGFVWKSRRNLSTDAYIFFDDRLKEDSFVSRGDGLALDTGQGKTLIHSALSDALVTVV